MEVGGQLQAPAALTTGQNPNTYWIRDRVNPTAGLQVLLTITWISVVLLSFCRRLVG